MTSTAGGIEFGSMAGSISGSIAGPNEESMSVVQPSLISMIIDCESCALYDPSVMENEACTDCVVSVIISIDSVAASAKSPGLNRERASRLSALDRETDQDTDQALALLSSRGLVPPLRFLPVNFG